MADRGVYPLDLNSPRVIAQFKGKRSDRRLQCVCEVGGGYARCREHRRIVADQGIQLSGKRAKLFRLVFLDRRSSTATDCRYCVVQAVERAEAEPDLPRCCQAQQPSERRQHPQQRDQRFVNRASDYVTRRRRSQDDGAVAGLDAQFPAMDNAAVLVLSFDRTCPMPIRLWPWHARWPAIHLRKVFRSEGT